MTEDFNSKDYFAHLYGAKDESGNPSQTKIDKLRDGLLVKLFNRYGQTKLSESSVIDIGCGYGWLLDYFDEAKLICGSDISVHAIEIAQKRKPERKYKITNFFSPKNRSKTGPKLAKVSILKAICIKPPCINMCVMICQDLK